MSNYRDDVVEVITVGDSTQSTLKMTLNDRLLTKDKWVGANKDSLVDAVRLTDGTTDHTIIALQEQIGVSDAIFDKKISRHMVVESITASDNISRIYRDNFTQTLGVRDDVKQTLTTTLLLSDGLIIKDENQHIIKDTLSDAVKAISHSDSERKLDDMLSERIKAQEYLLFGVRDEIGEKLTLKDAHHDQQGAKNSLSDHLIIRDSVVESLKKTSLLNDTIKVGDEIFGKLIAKDTLTDKAMIAVLDEVVQDSPNMAWTMNTVNQAMSQYAPFEIERVSVINGVLYGESKNGIYRLDGGDETIIGTLITDKIDYGEQLIKPSYAYTEYQTDGTMKLTVHTTQKGIKQSYTYTLPKERAGELTNGRFVFGRGLYGRQFAYTLVVTARTAFIHDLNIHFEKTTRRL